MFRTGRPGRVGSTGSLGRWERAFFPPKDQLLLSVAWLQTDETHALTGPQAWFLEGVEFASGATASGSFVYDNEVLIPGESFSVEFQIGMQARSRFNFLVDLSGVVEDNTRSAQARPFDLSVEARNLGLNDTLYLPMLMHKTMPDYGGQSIRPGVDAPR